MRFEALEISISVIRALRDPVARLEQKDRELARQIRTAASSVPANLAEGRRRAGMDRRHHWRIAAGSADEVHTTLRVAVAWGKLQQSEVDEALRLLDRVLAMTWRLTH
jgi:four helix bundle protein